MSRGLSEKEAKSLITEGTLLPLLQTLSDSKMKEKTKTALQELSL
jgi:Fe-S cluster assembly scaffold protein SufB